MSPISKETISIIKSSVTHRKIEFERGGTRLMGQCKPCLALFVNSATHIKYRFTINDLRVNNVSLCKLPISEVAKMIKLQASEKCNI